MERGCQFAIQTMEVFKGSWYATSISYSSVRSWQWTNPLLKHALHELATKSAKSFCERTIMIMINSTVTSRLNLDWVMIGLPTFNQWCDTVITNIATFHVSTNPATGKYTNCNHRPYQILRLINDSLLSRNCQLTFLTMPRCLQGDHGGWIPRLGWLEVPMAGGPLL